MLYLPGISIALFLGLLLLSKKNKSVSDKVLAVWLLVVAFHLFEYYLFITGDIYEYPSLLGLGMPLPLFHGPLLFIYVATLTGRMPSVRIPQLLHFLPAVLTVLYLIPFLFLPTEEKVFIFRHKGVGYETFMFIHIAAIILSGVVYVLWSAILLRKHRLSILDQFSYTEKINLDWLRYLVYGIALIWVFVIANNDTLVFGTAVLFVIFIGYFGIRQVGIFTHTNPAVVLESSPPPEVPADPAEKVMQDPQEEPVKKYSKSGLSEEAATRLHRQLTELMTKEKIFSDSELTLATLASRLNTAPNYLSQVINEREGKNFYDYINTLRVEEFKKATENPENRKFTLLALAYDCGFNSKSSFNKYFRKITGVAPMEYMKQQGN